MVIDTSAVLAIIFREPERDQFRQKLLEDPVRLISAASVLEASMTLESRKGNAAASELDAWLQQAAIETVPVDAQQIAAARTGWRRFGKGRHPAALNFGDCFVYALAITRNEPLLFKGNDFRLTDVKPLP